MATFFSARLQLLLVSAATVAGCRTPARQPASAIAVTGAPTTALSSGRACTCSTSAVSASALPALTQYPLTQGRAQSGSAMPFVEELARRTGHDLGRISAALLPKPVARAEGELPDEGLALGGPHILVGSTSHTTASWSYVLGDSIRIHQLLPLRARGFVVLYSLYSPDEILFQRTIAEWRLALFTVDDRLLANAVFLTRIPHPAPGSWSAIQTSLTVRSGRLLAEVTYLRGAPEPDPTPPASVASEQLLQRFEVLVGLGTTCLLVGNTVLIQDEFAPVAPPLAARETSVERVP